MALKKPAPRLACQEAVGDPYGQAERAKSPANQYPIPAQGCKEMLLHGREKGGSGQSTATICGGKDFLRRRGP